MDYDILNEKAKEFFKIDYIFPYQRIVINSILASNGFYGEDYQNEFLKRQISILPTGAGKSLCFMLPAAIIEGPILIVFPLLSLMADQKRRIEEASFKAFVLKGGLTSTELDEGFNGVYNGNIKFIITNPEMLSQEKVIERLSKVTFSNVVIDEAHTTTQWGDSFRSSYLNLTTQLKKLNYNFLSAFTATASESVLKRITEIVFDGEQYNLIYGNPDRENIYYSVIKTDSKKGALVELLNKKNYPILIFCRSRKRVKDIAKYLRLILKRENIFFYHAGLTKEEKNKIEKWFFDSADGVLVSTCAYGMGVDKSNIRTVIHFDLPTSVEAYLQESGRGGRDRKMAEAVLLFENSDKEFATKLDEKNKVNYLNLIKYVETNQCRREMLIENLGKKSEFCSGCDVCDNKVENYFYTEKLKKIRLKKNLIIQFLKGKFSLEILEYGCYYSKGWGMLKFFDDDTIDQLLKNKINISKIRKYKSIVMDYIKSKSEVLFEKVIFSNNNFIDFIKLLYGKLFFKRLDKK